MTVYLLAFARRDHRAADDGGTDGGQRGGANEPDRPGNTWLAFLGSTWTPWLFALLAIAELVADQLPSTPSRTVPMQFSARIVAGALSGAAIGAANGSMAGGLRKRGRRRWSAPSGVVPFVRGWRRPSDATVRLLSSKTPWRMSVR